jgi:two-component system nitrogen regulation sensor histidine kinase NtrY
MVQANAGGLKGKSLLEMNELLHYPVADLNVGESKIIALHGSRRVKCSRFEFLDRGFARTIIILEELTAELRQTDPNHVSRGQQFHGCRQFSAPFMPQLQRTIAA